MECPRCSGSGVCAECQGTGKIVCPSCEGRGQRTTPRGTTFNCKACGGSGNTPCDPKCSACEGTGQLSPELRQKVRDKYAVRWDNTNPLFVVSRWLVGICLLVFLAERFLPALQKGQLMLWCANDSEALANWQLWRLITPIFLHGSFLHLAFNVSFLWSYGPILEGLYGSRRFLALFLVSGAGGNLLSWLVHWLQHEPFLSVGASTSLFGLGAAFVALHYRFGLLSSEQVRPWLLFQVGYIVAGFLAEQTLGFGLDNWGHLGGFVTGFLFVSLMPRPHGR